MSKSRPKCPGHPLIGRKQSPEHIRRRTESTQGTRANWSPEYREAVRCKAAELMQKTRANWSPEYHEEVRRKNSEGHKGQPGWCKGRKCPEWSGARHPMFGKHHTPESIEANRRTKIGKRQSPELIQKRVEARRGYRHSEEVKERIRQTNLLTWARPEIRDKSIGPNSSSWLGGFSLEPYGPRFTKALKDSIIARDGQRCVLCGSDGGGIRLSVHHIDYNKKNSVAGNLISLCRPCHVRTNYRRPYWQSRLSVLVVTTQEPEAQIAASG